MAPCSRIVGIKEKYAIKHTETSDQSILRTGHYSSFQSVPADDSFLSG